MVAEGKAHIIEHDPLPLLRHVYVGTTGKEHPNWQEFDEAMVLDRRVVMAISIDRLYPSIEFILTGDGPLGPPR